MITEDYVSFETAKLLKEKGFDYHCATRRYYPEIPFDECDPNGVYAPTLQMAMKWLRENKGIAVIPVLSSVLDNKKFLWDVKVVIAEINDSYYQGWVYEKQEDACEAAIKYCLENLI